MLGLFNKLLFGRAFPGSGLNARQIDYTTVITNNFGSVTSVTILATVITETSSNSFSTTTWTRTSPTHTIYSTPTIPLTTTFTPAATCLSKYYIIRNFGWILGSPNDASCFPTGYASTIYFSPGICPSGYTSSTEAIDFLTISGTTITETVATCCPRYGVFDLPNSSS